MEIPFLVFKIGDELWSIDIKHVKEVVKVKMYTPVPRAPGYILGVFNLRGQIITLISLALILGMRDRENSVDKAVVVECSDEMFAIVVDDVVGVVRLDSENIAAPPEGVPDFIVGVFEYSGKLVSVVSIDKLYEFLVRGA